MLSTYWQWISQLNNSKTAAVVIFSATFIGIILYLFVFSSKEKKEEYDNSRYIALFDDNDLLELEKNKHHFINDQNKKIES